MHNDTITLFNRYESRLGDMWYATVIPGVHLTMDKAAIQAKYGEASQDNASVSVPFAVKDGKQLVASKEWLPPKQWDSQTNDLLPGTVTFTAGNEFDFFIVGAWDGKSVISDDEYASYSSFYDYMKRSHDYVFAVSSVGGPYNLIPHFEIMGR